MKSILWGTLFFFSLTSVHAEVLGRERKALLVPQNPLVTQSWLTGCEARLTADNDNTARLTFLRPPLKFPEENELNQEGSGDESLLVQTAARRLEIQPWNQTRNSLADFVGVLRLVARLPARAEKIDLYRAALWRVVYEYRSGQAPEGRTDAARMVFLVARGSAESADLGSALSPALGMISKYLILNPAGMREDDRFLLLSALIAGLGPRGFDLFGGDYPWILDQWAALRATGRGQWRTSSYESRIDADFGASAYPLPPQQAQPEGSSLWVH